jgi:hypothetical protein
MFGWKLGISQGLSVKNAFLYGFLIGVLVERVVSRGPRDPLLTTIHVPFLILILIAGISWMFTDLRINMPHYSSEDRLIAVKSLLVDLYLFFLVYYFGIRKIEDAIFLSKAILGLILVSNIVTVMDVYNVPDLGIVKQMDEMQSEANRGRLMGPIGEPNQYASFLILFLPSYVALALSSTSGLVVRSVYLLASGTTLVTLLLTGSRGGILGLAAGSLWGYWLIRKKVRLRSTLNVVMISVPVIGVAIMLAAMKYGALLMGRIEATSKAGTTTAASAGRTWIWETGFSVMMNHPSSFFTGMGWHTFAPYVGIVPHNTYLWYLFNLGIAGLVLYLLILRNVFRLTCDAVGGAAEDGDMLLKGFVLGFAALAISTLFVDLFAPWYFIWAYVGVMARVAVEMSWENQQEIEYSPVSEAGDIGIPSMALTTWKR